MRKSMGSAGRSLLTAESARSMVGTTSSSMYCLEDMHLTSEEEDFVGVLSPLWSLRARLAEEPLEDRGAESGRNTIV